MEKFIVYGSFRKKNLKPDTISGYKLFRVTDDRMWSKFPTVIKTGNKDDKVVVNVVKEDIRVMDHIEGYNPKNEKHSLYIRRKIKTDSGEEGWIYTYNQTPKKLELIESGDYTKVGKFYWRGE